MAIVALTTVPGRAQDDPPRFDGYRRQYVMIKKARPAPAAPFYDGSGTLIDLSRYRGKVVLLNLWATWCAPCVHEMPALNRLAGEMAHEAVAIVPVALDDSGLETVAAFYRHHGLHDLGLYLARIIHDGVGFGVFWARGGVASAAHEVEVLRLRGRACSGARCPAGQGGSLVARAASIARLSR